MTVAGVGDSFPASFLVNACLGGVSYFKGLLTFNNLYSGPNCGLSASFRWAQEK